MASSDLHSTGEETIYTQNLRGAKMFFAEQVKSHGPAQLEQVYTKVTQHLLFNIYVISKDIDVFVAFETMNNRGKPLSYLELLKNRLIFLSTRMGVDETERNQLRRVINESWKTAYHFLGRNRERPLDDDHFLDVQFLLYAGTRPTASDLGDRSPRNLWRMRRHREHLRFQLLENYFTSRNLLAQKDDGAQHSSPLTASALYEYAHDLKRCVETYYRVFNPADSDFDDDVRVHLAQIDRLGWRDSLPLVVAAIHCGGKPGDLAKLLSTLERHLFVLSIRLQHEDEELDLVSLGLTVATNSDSIKSATDKIHAITEKRVGKIDFAETLLMHSRGYYGWRSLSYLLFEYEQELKKKSRANRDKILWKEFCREDFEDDYRTIEHIYPQKAKDTYWKDRFGSLSIKKRNMLRNSLGNLLALSRAKNAALSNRPFPEKRDGSQESGGYRYGSYSEIDVSSCTEWTPQEIADRGVRMLEFIEQRWKLNSGRRPEKLIALGLQFIILDGDDDESDEDNSPRQGDSDPDSTV